MSDYKIRPANPTDNLALASIIRGVFIEHNAPKKGTVYSDPDTDDLYHLFNRENAYLFVVEKNDRVEGCCGIYPTAGLPDNCLELVKFYIRADNRGKGYGKALYLACEQKAIELGYQQLYLESTGEFKTAIGFYKKIGFVQIEKPIGNTGHYGCNLWFIKAL